MTWAPNQGHGGKALGGHSRLHSATFHSPHRDLRRPHLARKQERNPGAGGQKQEASGRLLRHRVCSQETPEVQPLPPAWTYPSLLSSEQMRQRRAEGAPCPSSHPYVLGSTLFLRVHQQLSGFGLFVESRSRSLSAGQWPCVQDPGTAVSTAEQPQRLPSVTHRGCAVSALVEIGPVCKGLPPTDGLRKGGMPGRGSCLEVVSAEGFCLFIKKLQPGCPTAQVPQ